MSCRVCRRPDSGTTDLCDTCEARAEHEQNLEDTREFGRPVAPTLQDLELLADLLAVDEDAA